MIDFRVGDKVYCLIGGEGEVIRIRPEAKFYPIVLKFAHREDDTYTNDGKRVDTFGRTLFHLGAITFDDKGRPTSIDWEYRPKRLRRDRFEEKVKETKLPQDFINGEKILYDSREGGIWRSGYFISATEAARDMYLVYNRYGSRTPTPAVIPYRGNEHMEGKPVTCDSGRMAEYYAARKKSECGHNVVLNVREEVKKVIDQEVAKIDFEKLAKKYVKKKYYISPEEWFWVAYGIVSMVNKK